MKKVKFINNSKVHEYSETCEKVLGYICKKIDFNVPMLQKELDISYVEARDYVSLLEEIEAATPTDELNFHYEYNEKVKNNLKELDDESESNYRSMPRYRRRFFFNDNEEKQDNKTDEEKSFYVKLDKFLTKIDGIERAKTTTAYLEKVLNIVAKKAPDLMFENTGNTIVPPCNELSDFLEKLRNTYCKAYKSINANSTTMPIRLLLNQLLNARPTQEEKDTLRKLMKNVVKAMYSLYLEKEGDFEARIDYEGFGEAYINRTFDNQSNYNANFQIILNAAVIYYKNVYATHDESEEEDNEETEEQNNGQKQNPFEMDETIIGLPKQKSDQTGEEERESRMKQLKETHRILDEYLETLLKNKKKNSDGEDANSEDPSDEEDEEEEEENLLDEFEDKDEDDEFHMDEEEAYDEFLSDYDMEDDDIALFRLLQQEDSLKTTLFIEVAKGVQLALKECEKNHPEDFPEDLEEFTHTIADEVTNKVFERYSNDKSAGAHLVYVILNTLRAKFFGEIASVRKKLLNIGVSIDVDDISEKVTRVKMLISRLLDSIKDFDENISAIAKHNAYESLDEVCQEHPATINYHEYLLATFFLMSTENKGKEHLFKKYYAYEEALKNGKEIDELDKEEFDHDHVLDEATISAISTTIETLRTTKYREYEAVFRNFIVNTENLTPQILRLFFYFMIKKYIQYEFEKAGNLSLTSAMLKYYYRIIAYKSDEEIEAFIINVKNGGNIS